MGLLCKCKAGRDAFTQLWLLVDFNEFSLIFNVRKFGWIQMYEDGSEERRWAFCVSVRPGGMHLLNYGPLKWILMDSN